MEDLSIDNLDNISTGSDDHMQITPGEIVEMLEEAWANEKFAPEILPNKSEVVDIILDQITTMEENIKKLNSAVFTRSIYQLEVDRLRFLVSSYLRTRLEKIERYVTHILKEEDKRIERGEAKYLTEQEFEFAKEFSFTMEQYFDKMMRFYPGVPSDTWSNKIIQPNNNTFVFFKSKKTIEGVTIDEGNAESDLVDIYSGSRVLISYNSIAELVKNGDVHLI